MVALQKQSDCSNFPSDPSLRAQGPSEEEGFRGSSTHTPARVTAISTSIHSEDRKQTPGPILGNGWESKPEPSCLSSTA